MARKNYGLEKGIDIYAENGDLRIAILQGTAAPDGTSGDQGTAPIGSLYIRSGTGEFYQKIANAGAPSDYEQNGAASASIGNWRPERVDALSNDTLSAGAQNPTTWTDNDDATAAAAFTVGHYVIGDADGTPALFEVTNVSAPNITLAAAATPLAADDTLAVKYYMPDPAGQENQAIVNYDGSVMIKVADVDFAIATGISLSGSYSPASGDIAASEQLESAVQKLDGNNDAQDTTLGTAQGATSLGTFTGATISDNGSVKAGMQELETAHETLSSSVTEIDGNVDDLITLSGVAENATDKGTMDSGDILSDSATNNALLKETDAELTRQRGKSSAGPVTALTVIDSVDVNSVAAADWLVTIEDVATQKSAHFRVFAGHDGSSDGVTDATASDNTLGKILKIGGNFNYAVTVDINGTGAGQVMRLNVSSSEGLGVNVFAKREEVLF